MEGGEVGRVESTTERGSWNEWNYLKGLLNLKFTLLSMLFNSRFFLFSFFLFVLSLFVLRQ